MNIKELRERVKLTPGEIRVACHKEFYGSVLRTSTGEELYQAVADAQLNNVLNDPDIAEAIRNMEVKDG